MSQAKKDICGFSLLIENIAFIKNVAKELREKELLLSFSNSIVVDTIISMIKNKKTFIAELKKRVSKEKGLKLHRNVKKWGIGYLNRTERNKDNAKRV